MPSESHWSCRAVCDEAVAPAPDEHGEILLVAHVIPAARPPTPDRLRAALWSRLPGYAWPLFAAGIDMRGGSGQRVLSALWAVDPATRAGPTTSPRTGRSRRRQPSRQPKHAVRRVGAPCGSGGQTPRCRRHILHTRHSLGYVGRVGKIPVHNNVWSNNLFDWVTWPASRPRRGSGSSSAASANRRSGRSRPPTRRDECPTSGTAGLTHRRGLCV